MSSVNDLWRWRDWGVLSTVCTICVGMCPRRANAHCRYKFSYKFCMFERMLSSFHNRQAVSSGKDGSCPFRVQNMLPKKKTGPLIPTHPAKNHTATASVAMLLSEARLFFLPLEYDLHYLVLGCCPYAPHLRLRAMPLRSPGIYRRYWKFLQSCVKL